MTWRNLIVVVEIIEVDEAMLLITCHYYAYTNANILVHLSVFEFSSVGLKLVRFTLTKGAGVPQNYVL